MASQGVIHSNILILYDYTMAGEAPTLINVPHGNNMLRTVEHGSMINGTTPVQMQREGEQDVGEQQELAFAEAENPVSRKTR